MHTASTAGKKADLPNVQRTVVDLKVCEHSEVQNILRKTIWCKERRQKIARVVKKSS